jgi:hypothetical protein
MEWAQIAVIIVNFFVLAIAIEMTQELSRKFKHIGQSFEGIRWFIGVYFTIFVL